MRDTPERLTALDGFPPSGMERMLSISARVLAVLFGLLLLGALLLYGIQVHFEDNINQVARQTREMNEQNKELQVRLNHIRSYKNVEAQAAGVPHLRMAETVIEVPASHPAKLPAMPADRQESPRVYGY